MNTVHRLQHEITTHREETTYPDTQRFPATRRNADTTETMTSTRNAESVERTIAAPASTIFALLANPVRHRDIDGSGTVRDASEPSQALTLGSKFGMDMKLGLSYSMQSTVIEFEQDRLIAWQTAPSNSIMAKLAGGRIWRYELEPVEGGTLVRETWDISKEVVPAFVRPLRSRTNKAMAATLERIEALVVAN